jgi:hypothetical protein
MYDIEIKLNPSQINLIHDLLGSIPKEIPKIMRSAINTTATQARNQIVKNLLKTVKLPGKILRDAIKLTRATTTRWIATIDVHGKRIPLIYFGARQIAFGVTYRISDIMGPALARRAFIQKANNFTGVFMRMQKKFAVRTLSGKWKSAGSKKAGYSDMVSVSGGKNRARRFTGSEGDLVPRYPIRFLRGPSPGALLESMPGLAQEVAVYAEYNLEKNIDEQIVRVLQRMKIAAETAA